MSEDSVSALQQVEDARARKRLVRRAWCVLSGVDPDELEAEIDRRAEEIKREMTATILGFHRPRSYTELFEVHAAPEAIQAHIAKARKKQTEIQNELGWLEGLYLRRVAERAAE